MLTLLSTRLLLDYGREQERDVLTARLGTVAGKVALAMGVATHSPTPADPKLLRALLGTLSGDQAFLCAEALGADHLRQHVLRDDAEVGWISDPAILMDAGRARELGIPPLARLVAYAATGCLPEEMGIGPITAIPKALHRAGLTLNDIGLIEFNEAFAAQALAVIRVLSLDPERINVNGGAIALGHPLGCSGAKLTATLLHEMRRRQVRYGMVTMCVGGGMGAAGIFELL